MRGKSIDGITISGGDPLEQVDDCLTMIELLQDI